VRECIVTFRVDAGPAIGIGHLRRCLTLAAEFRERGCKVSLVCSERLESALEPLVAPYTVYRLEDVLRDAEPRDAQPPDAQPPDAIDAEMRDADATLLIIGHRRSAESWVVLDNYQLGHRWERRLRDAGHRILVIDDYRDRRHHADMLLSEEESPFNPALNELADAARVLVGRQYALVDPDYAFSSLVVANLRADAKRLLVTYGGSDPTGETLKALEAIRGLRNDKSLGVQVGRVDIVIGLANPKSAEIMRAAEGLSDVFVHKGPLSLGSLMREADLVLTAGGNSMVEALTLRKPCIATVTGDNQALMVRRLFAEGAIRSLGHHSTVKPRDILKKTTDVLADFDTFAAFVASKSLFDHLGARRIASAVLTSSELAD
jgi:UDP-2,4-diacetamido-2,4,6-trideoxy-beta-L-altropyranose hydrolase